MRNVSNIVSSCPLELEFFGDISEESCCTDALVRMIDVELGDDIDLISVIRTFERSFLLNAAAQTLIQIIPDFAERDQLESLGKDISVGDSN